ncbi:hypothetical protein TMO_a0293 (plasmid) [Tistrella mobilis KA081020-065]|uniref:Uncharacterized protein n=1 Tax=Tistrella mobilis (strain KA081020-065) TaxID=1110502 RepID=I3TSF8_TISMK|nr:hypothetical protein TMO_a0293 [Tistrella mobilis KA081020-065]
MARIKSRFSPMRISFSYPWNLTAGHIRSPIVHHGPDQTGFDKRGSLNRPSITGMVYSRGG